MSECFQIYLERIRFTTVDFNGFLSNKLQVECVHTCTLAIFSRRKPSSDLMKLLQESESQKSIVLRCRKTLLGNNTYRRSFSELPKGGICEFPEKRTNYHQKKLAVSRFLADMHKRIRISQIDHTEMSLFLSIL